MIDDKSAKLDEYRTLLSQCVGRQCESTFQKVADSYEDDLLEFEEFPEDYFRFVLELLSNATFYAKPGIWNFLLVLGTEQGKLQPRHYRGLVEQIVSNYGKYENADLCLAVCDFIARNYSGSDARPVFEKLAEIEGRKPRHLQGFVADCLRILAAEEQRALKDKH
jgi:hypothetical protein